SRNPGRMSRSNSVVHRAAFAIAAADSARYHLKGRVMIRLNNVTKLYPAKAAGGGVIRALDDFSLQVAAGEWIAVMGPSGSGKSTLVNLIGCLDSPSSGEIFLNDQPVGRLSANELTRVRAEKIGFVFQQFHLIPYLTAVENVMLAQYFH